MNKDLKRLLAENKEINNEILMSLENDLAEMEKELEALCEFEGDISKEVRRLVKGGGKRLRPVLAWLGFQVGKADPSREDTDYPIIPLMCAVELIHTSSLIHDDIVDEAEVRRAVPTINATSGNYVAAQAGDYLLAKAVGLAKPYKGIRADRSFSDIARQMCVAEFMQIDNAYKYSKESLSNYFAQIERKTAAFISAAVSTGATAGGASEKTRDHLKEYGKNIGIAFQLRDDMLDMSSDESFGKKCGQDLKSGLLTFPLICALDAGCDKEIKALVTAKEKSDEDIDRILRYVKESEALSIASKEVNKYTQKAIEALKKIDDSPAKDMLLRLAEGLAVRSM